MAVVKTSTSWGTFVPEVHYTFLPGCKSCGGAHPLARKQACDPEVCPDCGEPAGAPGETLHQEAYVTGFKGALASSLVYVGKFLNKFAKGI
jgi:hypothetical protein